MNQERPTVVGLGELIWDILPGGKQLGGAPTNFAYISRLLGAKTVVATRIGSDELGREAALRLERMGISTLCLQHDALHPTGTVGVRIGERGEPHFTVNQNSAWDYLEWTPQWEELAARTDAVCFGTLGQRHPQARETIIRFLKAMRHGAVRIFDVNLRHSFFNAEMLSRALELATIVKFNSEELSIAARLLQLDASDEEALARRLIERFRIELVAVTRGENGSLLINGAETIAHTGFRVEVVDTIGAGDAFTAALAHHYLLDVPLHLISEAANRMGSWIATQAGATPAVMPDMLPEMPGVVNIVNQE